MEYAVKIGLESYEYSKEFYYVTDEYNCIADVFKGEIGEVITSAASHQCDALSLFLDRLNDGTLHPVVAYDEEDADKVCPMTIDTDYNRVWVRGFECGRLPTVEAIVRTVENADKSIGELKTEDTT